MIIRPFLAAIAVVPFGAVVAGLISPRDSLSGNVDRQNKVSLQGVLNNIGPKGSKAPGASPGVIIASPSTKDPNYYYTWTRDAGLTMKMLVDEFLGGREELKPYIEDYLKAQAILQTVSNPSGALSSGRGLGEPKIYANLTRFNGNWGRPQRDGPALRATALITYANWLLDNGHAKEVKDKVWPVVQNDLNYVAQYWNETTFDLWEEVRGSSFFTSAVQHRALVEGTTLGKKVGASTKAYESQAPNVLCFLQSYWNGKYAVANINTEAGFSRKGIDANTVLTSIATFDPEAECDDATFQPCSPRALANLKVYVDSFREIYTINDDRDENAAVATGRYAEDVYYEGNPWYLTTLAVAEQLYDAIQQWDSIENIRITAVDLPFWKSIVPSAKPGIYTKHSGQFHKLVNSALNYADDFVKVALEYIPEDGALAEQFSRENGTAVSAEDLTWSYASFVTMRSARLAATGNHPQVPSWGASTLHKYIPQTCKSSSVIGVYAPAVAAGAPADAGGCTILVSFHVNATTFFGENIYLTGNVSELGNWRPTDALPGQAFDYTESHPLWTFDVELPANSTVQYHYMRKVEESIMHETKNRTLKVPICANRLGPGTAVVEDAWTGPSGTPTPTPSGTPVESLTSTKSTPKPTYASG